jgi:hypothetical protein
MTNENAEIVLMEGSVGVRQNGTVHITGLGQVDTWGASTVCLIQALPGLLYFSVASSLMRSNIADRYSA